jgi:nicotinic acid mononucleotide adenylyltransferase
MVSVTPDGSRTEHAPCIFLVDVRTPDVSSTDIRKRLLAGESIRNLVPAAVERHIVQHGLYAQRGGPLAADHLHGEN